VGKDHQPGVPGRDKYWTKYEIKKTKEKLFAKIYPLKSKENKCLPHVLGEAVRIKRRYVDYEMIFYY